MVQSVSSEGDTPGSLVSDWRKSDRGAFVALVSCGFAGLLCGLSQAWPLSWGLATGRAFWLGAVFAVGALYALVLASTKLSHAITRIWVFSVAWLSGTIWWLFVAMHQYGGLNAALAVVSVALLAATLGLYYVCAIALFWRWKDTIGRWRPLVFAALWTIAELARGTWLSGFGWGGIGYAQVDGPFALLAPWVGVYGIGGAVVLTAASVVEKSWHRYLRLSVVSVLILLAIVPTPRNVGWTHSTGKLDLALLQGNIPQDEKFEPGSGIPLALNWYREQLLSSTRQLTIAPETAIPLLPAQLPPAYWEAIRDKFSQQGPQALLVGIPLGDMASGYTNSVLGLGGGESKIHRYDKHHLVPFGEYIPPFFRWFTELMQIPLGDFASGSLGQDPFEAFGQRLGINICYEDLFGEELAVRFRDESKAPTLFVNHSNIGWFGDTVAIDQHLHISRMRAMEFERPFVRATNTGATAIIDHEGKVVAELARYTRGVLHGSVEGRSGLTPYAWWVSRWGLWPIWIIALLVSVGAWWHNKVHGVGYRPGATRP